MAILAHGLPAQHGTIRITSVAGERRDVSVSGLAKAQLLWLFRHFCILDFPVLNKKQQQLIAQVWHAAPSAASEDTPLDLIGTIDGFEPRLYPPSLPTPSSLPAPSSLPTLVPTPPSLPTPSRSSRHGSGFGLSKGLRISAIWSAVGVLLLGCAIRLGPMHRWMPQSHVAAVAAASPVSSMPPLLARTSSQSAPSVTGLPASASEASGVPPLPLPDAMAQPASSLKETSPHPPLAAGGKALGKPEVMIRVSVDSEGRAQAFQVLRGDRKKISAALAAAKRWSFQPCSGSVDCEHLLKFTDYGDASIVHMID